MNADVESILRNIMNLIDVAKAVGLDLTQLTKALNELKTIKLLRETELCFSNYVVRNCRNQSVSEYS